MLAGLIAVSTIFGATAALAAHTSSSAGPGSSSTGANDNTIVLRMDMGVANYNNLSSEMTAEAFTIGGSLTADIGPVFGFTLMANSGTSQSIPSPQYVNGATYRVSTLAVAPTVSIHSSLARFYLGPAIGYGTLSTTPSAGLRSSVRNSLLAGAIAGLDVPVPYVNWIVINFNVRSQSLLKSSDGPHVQMTQFLGGLGIQL